MDDEPRAIDDASDGFGRLQSVENASDLAQPVYQYRFKGVSRGGRSEFHERQVLGIGRAASAGDHECDVPAEQ